MDTALTATFSSFLLQVESHIQFLTHQIAISEQTSSSLSTLLASSSPSPSSNKQGVAWNAVREAVREQADAAKRFSGAVFQGVVQPLVGFKRKQQRVLDRISSELPLAKQAYEDKHRQVSLFRARYRSLSEDYRAEYLHQSSLSSHSHTPAGEFEDPIALGSSKRDSSSLLLMSPAGGKHFSLFNGGGGKDGPASAPIASTSAAAASGSASAAMAASASGGMLPPPSAVDKGLALSSKGVKAKRDLDEADRLYRQSVHELESYRLRCRKGVLAAAHNIDDFVHQLSELLAASFALYASLLAGNAASQSSVAANVLAAAQGVVPSYDVQKFRQKFPREQLEASMPPKVYYWNDTVGECRSLIFGVRLLDYAREGATAAIPLIVRSAVDEIDARGLDVEGIYRVSGRIATVQELARKIEKDESVFHFQSSDDIHSIAGVLKQYLRQLPEPVFKFSLEDRLEHSRHREDHIANNFSMLRGKIRRLPPVHSMTLRLLIEHLTRVVRMESVNKMGIQNLNIVFRPFLFGESDVPTGPQGLLTMGAGQDTVLEDLILYQEILFADVPPIRPMTSNSAATGSNISLSAPISAIARDQQMSQANSNPSTPLPSYDARSRASSTSTGHQVEVGHYAQQRSQGQSSPARPLSATEATLAATSQIQISSDQSPTTQVYQPPPTQQNLQQVGFQSPTSKVSLGSRLRAGSASMMSALQPSGSSGDNRYPLFGEGRGSQGRASSSGTNEQQAYTATRPVRYPLGMTNAGDAVNVVIPHPSPGMSSQPFEKS